MGTVALIGGMATGKQQVVNAVLARDSGVNWVPLSLYMVKVPLSYAERVGINVLDLLERSKSEYLDLLLSAAGHPLISPERSVANEFSRAVMNRYGPTFIGEICMAAQKHGVPNLFDNIARASNVRFLRDRGVYVAGFACSIEDQIYRAFHRAHSGEKVMDAANLAQVREDVSVTNALFEVPEILGHAHKIYDTTDVRSDSPGRVQEILERLHS